MAKSLRSKWKRKMRAIKRVTMDEKVLIRMKKMLAASEIEQRIDMEEEKLKQQKKKASEPVEMAESENPAGTAVEVPVPAPMELEGEQPKKKKFSLKTMKNEKGEYPAWMTSKKIKHHVRLTKRKDKRNTKEARMSRNWKIANSL